MLFSEPKIPQFWYDGRQWCLRSPQFQCSSASRKFLNSIEVVMPYRTYHFQFQCSSASRKFLNKCDVWTRWTKFLPVSVLFSEPKIPQSPSPLPEPRLRRRFQCSSASRKFLNGGSTMPKAARDEVSVLFSEPKIPQFFGRCL